MNTFTVAIFHLVNGTTSPGHLELCCDIIWNGCIILHSTDYCILLNASLSLDTLVISSFIGMYETLFLLVCWDASWSYMVKSCRGEGGKSCARL